MLRSMLLAAALTLAASHAGAYEVYYGNLHAHTALSDGIGTPEEAFAYARDVADIDVLALTDHTHYLTQTEWELTEQVAAQYTQDGVFVALNGQEFGKLNDFGHIGIYDVDFRNPNATTNLPATYFWIEQNDGVGNFCHPDPSYGTWFDNFDFAPQFPDAMHSLEMRNGLRNDDYEPEAIFALNKGWKVGFFGNQDNHEGHWGDLQNPSDGGAIYLTGILADALTEADITDALHNRRFFAMEVNPSSDRIKLWYWVNGEPMGSIIETEGPVDITAHVEAVNGVSLFNRFDLFKDGEIVDSYIEIGTQIDYAFQEVIGENESHYYFIRARQVDGDYAWSASVWVQQQGATAAPDLPEISMRGVRLLPNIPNPFHPDTEIRYESSGVMEGPVHLAIYDVQGRVVRNFGLVPATTGVHSVRWDGKDGAGRDVAAGMYLVRLRTSRGEDTSQGILLSP